MYIHINVGILFQLVFLEIITCDEEENINVILLLVFDVEIRLIM